jgi:hypothetical protein
MEIEMNNAPQALTLCDYVAIALLALIAGVELWTTCLAIIGRRRAARAALTATAKDETQRVEAHQDKLDQERTAGLQECKR